MKRLLFAFFVVGAFIASTTGCANKNAVRSSDCLTTPCDQAAEQCAVCSCDSDPSCVDPKDVKECKLRCRRCRDREMPVDPGYSNAGPQTPTIVYPYYTIRGPRDFLAKNPPSIGP